ncbi:sialate O-acetylesterase [Arsenicibacter rosenii]|uniref:Sialate O-acetylesterase domain-containing protein n=1 Tax=Arsenicibacter rosenii TaxID=1750698 RepID=A0A1S2VC30_9BACT|nr:sialate O-acetylesterase [Arsenicibacter rosenii]OIN56274.1 hypothetical protein BLX24_25520 [Arsenicibacter rosenii]
MRHFILLVSLLAFGVSSLKAQVQISSPQSRIVYQRNKSNQANVMVAGTAPANATRAEARLVALNGGQTTDWTTIPLLSSGKAFKGSLTGQAGWYQLNVRVWSNSSLLGESTIDRVGIGEVFIVAGQSNAVGVHDTEGATDDRISCVDFRDNELHEQLLPVAFSQAVTGANIGPSNPLHVWGMLGQRLVQRLNVPVLILGAAQAATSSEQWRRTAEGTGDASGLPYRRLGVAILHYASRTGLRGILWHQGEGDVGRGGDQYFSNLQYIINKSREQLHFGNLAWVISRATYTYGQTDESVISAQNRLINLVPNAFEGPYTDVLTGGENRPDNVHFGGTGLIRLTELWDQSLNNEFFNRSTPFSVSGDTPLITTGHITPYNRASGEQIWVPYVQRGPFENTNQFKAQLLADNGNVVAESGTSTQNPLPLQLPGNLATGMYRVRVVATQPAIAGVAGEAFRIIQGGAPSGSGESPVLQNVVGGQLDATIIRMGYRYDAPSHGFSILINATSATEVRMERIDGGYFGETNWAIAPANTDYGSFNFGRYYSPVSVGVGGVEPGRYRLSARKAGNSGAGQWVEVTLVNGRNTIFQADSDGTTTTPPATTTTTPPSTTTTTPPVSTTPDPTTQPGTPPVTTYVQRIGYKYDAPTHGFQLLAQASGLVDMKLERLDGTFGETNWGSAVQNTEFFSFNNFRYYAPQAMGVGGVEPGRYRLSIRKPNDNTAIVTTEVILENGIHTITFTDTGQPTTPTPWDKPLPVNPGADVVIRTIGYKYDMPTHGFHLLADVTGAVEMRLERIDGGTFNETNWASATSNSEFGGYSVTRYYAPLAMGVAGVEPGRYRLSVRKTGDNSNGQSVEVDLQNGLFAVGTGTVNSAKQDVVITPQPAPANGQLTAIGYKYDMPTHGFQLLINATTAVEVKLERLDGYFGETNWATAASGNQYAGYTNFRTYNPLSMGVGGVEPGRYRLSARLAGDTGQGISTDVTLGHGVFGVWAPAGRQAVVSEAAVSSPEATWRAWPNPVNRYATVSVPVTASGKALRVVLFSASGVPVSIPEPAMRGNQLEVDLNQLPTGLYLLRISDDTQPLQTVRILKE